MMSFTMLGIVLLLLRLSLKDDGERRRLLLCSHFISICTDEERKREMYIYVTERMKERRSSCLFAFVDRFFMREMR